MNPKIEDEFNNFSEEDLPISAKEEAELLLKDIKGIGIGGAIVLAIAIIMVVTNIDLDSHSLITFFIISSLLFCPVTIGTAVLSRFFYAHQNYELSIFMSKLCSISGLILWPLMLILGSFT